MHNSTSIPASTYKEFCKAARTDPTYRNMRRGQAAFTFFKAHVSTDKDFWDRLWNLDGEHAESLLLSRIDPFN